MSCLQWCLPPGGVVIFAVNSLLYLNQSVPPYGVALNSLTTGTTAFPLRKWSALWSKWDVLGAGQDEVKARHSVYMIMFPTGTQEGVRITLDCAQAAFISYDKMVISLKGGEM